MKKEWGGEKLGVNVQNYLGQSRGESNWAPRERMSASVIEERE